MRWRGRWMALTIDGDLHMGAYRRDLFGDPANRQAFQARYGRPLQPPRTWGEYRDIAAFFNGRHAPDGTPLAGTLEAYARGGQRIWYLFSHAAAYAPPPGPPRRDVLRPGHHGPGHRQPCLGPGSRRVARPATFGPADASTPGQRGGAPTVCGRPGGDEHRLGRHRRLGRRSETSASPAMSASSPSRGAARSGTPARGAWERLPAVARSPSSPSADGSAWSPPPARPRPGLGLPRLVREPGAQRRGPPRRQLRHQPLPCSRTSTTRHPGGACSGTVRAQDYLDVLRASLSAPDRARDLRLPGYRAYIAALEDQLDRVMTGESSPRRAFAPPPDLGDAHRPPRRAAVSAAIIGRRWDLPRRAGCDSPASRPVCC